MRSLRAKGIVVVLIPSLALLGAAAALLFAQRHASSREAAVNQTVHVRQVHQRVLGRIVDAETGVRG